MVAGVTSEGEVSRLIPSSEDLELLVAQELLQELGGYHEEELVALDVVTVARVVASYFARDPLLQEICRHHLSARQA